MYKPKYFQESEFARCIPPCKLSDMDSDFLERLDKARELARTPFILNSAFRTVSYERSKGRSGGSSHCKGIAVDLHCSSSHVRYFIVKALISAGFDRIGIYPTFIHVDSDSEKISCIWQNDSWISAEF